MTAHSNKEHIKEALKALSKTTTDIYVFISPVEDYHKNNYFILKYLTKTLKLKGIHVTLNASYKSLSNDLKSNGTNTENLFFIDGISKTQEKVSNTKNCIFIQSPRGLTELSLAITDTINTGDYDFLFFDSISTLLIHNELRTAEKFSHYLINKLKHLDLRGIIISLDEEDSKRLLPILSQVCDKCIHC